MRSITSEDHIQHVRERGGADSALPSVNWRGFRVSVFRKRGNFGMVLRQIPDQAFATGTNRPAAIRS